MAKIHNLMCSITCRNKAQHRQRRVFVSSTASCSLHSISTIPKFDYEMNCAVQPKDYRESDVTTIVLESLSTNLFFFQLTIAYQAIKQLNHLTS